jgi:hypothetical protein
MAENPRFGLALLGEDAEIVPSLRHQNPYGCENERGMHEAIAFGRTLINVKTHDSLRHEN